MGHDRQSYIILATGISIHPSRVGWDCRATACRTHQKISIHPSRVGWDQRAAQYKVVSRYFNPPIPCGMGHVNLRHHAILLQFQSTHPVWDGTDAYIQRVTKPQHFNPPIPCGMGPRTVPAISATEEFQSTHPVWDGTAVGFTVVGDFRISIHPSRVGWDPGAIPPGAVNVGISIHPSRVGWDPAARFATMKPRSFQSTHPVWDGTRSALA